MLPKPTRRPLARWLGWAPLATLVLPGLAVADSITLNWTAPGDDGNTGRASSYELRYSDQPVAGQDTVGWWSAAVPVGTLPAPQSAGNRESFTVSGLTAGATYYFVLRTSDEVPNVSGFSNVRARTVSGGAVAMPLNFNAQPVNGAAHLTWDAPASTGDGYHLYRRTGGASADTLVQSLTPSATEWTDSTVTIGVAYEYRLTTYLGVNESAPAYASITIPAVGVEETPTTVSAFPNPAPGTATILYRAETRDGAPGHVRLVVYSKNGNRIAELLDGVVPSGPQTIVWACRTDDGKRVAPGIYNLILDGPRGRDVYKLAVIP